jgi:hypothetical protein
MCTLGRVRALNHAVLPPNEVILGVSGPYQDPLRGLSGGYLVICPYLGSQEGPKQGPHGISPLSPVWASQEGAIPAPKEGQEASHQVLVSTAYALMSAYPGWLS